MHRHAPDPHSAQVRSSMPIRTASGNAARADGYQLALNVS
jgi:hypothetical protein